MYALTVRTVQRMRRLMNQASFDQATGQALLSITGEVTEHAGWLAFDAGRHAEARYWWLEALQAAHRANSNDVTTVALASMSLQAATQGRAHEAIDTAHAAQRAARARLTPRLRSILHAREALGHARNHDAKPAQRALGQAATQLEHGRHDDDPAWLDFWDHADLAWHTMLAAVDLGDLPGAEQAARGALAAVTRPPTHATTRCT